MNHTPMSSPEASRWVTREELATLAGVSVDTVIRDCLKHGLRVRHDERGRVLVCVDDFEAIRDVNGPVVTEAAVLERLLQALVDLQYDVYDLAREVEMLRALIEEEKGLEHEEA